MNRFWAVLAVFFTICFSVLAVCSANLACSAEPGIAYDLPLPIPPRPNARPAECPDVNCEQPALREQTEPSIYWQREAPRIDIVAIAGAMRRSGIASATIIHGDLRIDIRLATPARPDER